MAQDKVNRYLENRKKRLEDEGKQTNVSVPLSTAGAGATDRVNDYLKRREERIASSGYEQKLRQRDVIVGQRAQENRMRNLAEATARQENEVKARKIEQGMGWGSRLMLDRQRETAQERAAENISRATEALRQRAEEQETASLPSFKRQNLTGNDRFAQAEATGEYNPYEDALAAVKQRMAEQAAERAREQAAVRAQEQIVAWKPDDLPVLTSNNQLLGGNFSLEDYNPPQTPNPEIEKQLKEADEAAAQSAFDAGEWAEANAKAGWTQIGGRIMQGINAAFEPAQAAGVDLFDFALRKMRGDEYADMFKETLEAEKAKPALGAVYDWAVDPMNKATDYAEAVNEEGGYLAKIGGSVIQNAVAQIPNAITALMSGGASTALDAFNRAQTTFGGAVLESAKKMATNPNFLMSFGQMYGGRYEDANAGGANAYTAALTSTITTLMNSIVEMGGGIENLPFTRATVGDWVKNALVEGKEEVIQQVIDQMGQKAMVDSSIPWYSTEDQNAVINPKVLGENALLGALAGGVIGGPGMVVNNIMNRGTQEQRETFEGAPEISDIAMELIQDENREKLEPIREENKGQKYAQMSAEDIRTAQESAQQTDNYGDPIARMAQEAADAEMAEERGEAAPVQAAPVSRETISREVPAAPVRAEAAVSQDVSTAQRSMPETQVEQAARRIENEASKRQFVQAAEKYGEAATVFAHNYEGGDIATYDRAFNHLYSAGQTNLPLNRIREATDALTAGMSESAKQAIWQAGRNADVKNIKAGVQMRTTVKLSDRQKRQFKMLDEMAKRFDYEIDIVDSIAGGMANGAYTGGRRIVVAADAAEEAIVQTGVHELVHGLKANDEAGYRVLEEVVLKHLQSEDRLFDLEYAIGARIKEYANGGQTLTRDAAIEEIVCEAVPTFLTDEAAVKAFVRDNGTLAAKIRDFFINFAKEIREIAMRYMQRDGMDRDEIANLLGRSDALTEIAQTFDRALEAAGEKEAAPGGETVFARKKNYTGVMSKKEFGMFYDKISEMKIGKEAQFHVSRDGHHIFDIENKLVYTDGNWYKPYIDRVVEFHFEDGTDMDAAKYLLVLNEDRGVDFEQTREILEDVYGEGCVVLHLGEVREADGREAGRGKGSAGRTVYSRNGKVSAEGEEVISNSGLSVSDDGEIAYPAAQETMYSLRTLPETDYIKERDKAAAALAKRMGIEAKDAQRYIDNLTGVAAMIAADRARLDYEHESAYSAIKHNSEYKWTVDFSTLCKKRLLYTGTFDAIQSKLHDTVLTEDDYIRLRDMMAKKGYEVACAFCYVESRRKNNGEIISKFLDIYREAEKSGGVMELGPSNRRKSFRIEKGFSPEIADFNTSEGIANILHNHKDVYDAYMYFMNARGVSKPKLIESRTDYTNEILSKFKSASTVKAMNRRGGLRLQSFSDFEVINLLDMMQVVTDMARVGLMSQAYTKVPAFARVFGGTGVKINLSLVTKGVDKNGKLIFDDVEGMPHEEAFRIREMYSENVGTILVGRDDATIRAAMKDPRIDFIIPYHASCWSTENQEALGIAGYTNYTMGQNETSIATGKGMKNLYPAEYWKYDKTGDENAEIYLQRCAETGRTPKFPQFAGESGYWKMLIDFKMYDNNGKGVPQRAVRPDVNMAEAKKVLDEYKGGHVKLPVAQDIVDEFLSEYHETHEDSGVKFSLSNTAPIESVMADDQNLMLPADVDVREESIKGVAASALSRGISERMDQQITGVANKILKETGSTYAKADIIANMKSLIDEYAANGATEETLRAVAEMAKKIIESSSRADNTLREQYADIRKKLRETGISLTETQKQEAANEAGSYNAYRQSLMGTVKLTNDGISLDSIWGELSSQNPEIFPADTGEAEMVGKLTDFMMLMKPKYENPYGMDMDGAALEMAMRIQADLMGILGARDAAKAMYGTAEKFRKQYEAEFKVKLAQQKKERVEKFQKIASELKAAKAKGDSAEQAKIMNRYRAALKATALDEAYAEVRATYKAREEQKAENRKANELRGRVAKRAGELMKMFARPEKGKRIPTGLQGLVLDVLETLDINGEHAAAAGKETKKAAEFRKKLGGIRSFYEQVINSQSKGEAPEGMDGLMMAFTERNLGDVTVAIETLLESGDKFRLRDMNSRELHFLESLLNTVKHTVETVGKLWRIQRYQNVAELAETSIEEMSARGKRKNRDGSAGAVVRDFLALDMLEPVSYGERLGEGGSVIVQGLMDGEKEKFAKIREAAEATAHMMNDAEINGYDIGKWRKHIHTIKLGDGHVVKMTDVEVMELYVSANRPQGLQHLLGGGMVLEDSKRAGVRGDEITLTQADIAKITKLMDPKQKKIADMMQAYLSSDVAKWGNDVTQRMYLYDAFTEQTYWPISSDSDSLKTSEPERDRSLTAITNAGITKALNEKANNAIIIGDIFDTFNKHIGDMASYAGYAEVMTDALAWFNYRQKAESGQKYGGVKKAMRDLLGEDGISYLTKLLQDINGARRGGDGMQIANALLRNYKANAVAGKIRVAIQQPTSIVRAAAEINPAYLLTGLKAGKGAVQEMQKWSNLAWWKSNGNYDIGIGKSTDEIFWGDTKRSNTVMEKISTSGGLIDPGKMDDWAWARMWNAVKREISRTRPELNQGSDEYFKAVAERFEYIVDRTQVVDTVMHRSDMMRSKDGLIQTLTSFKAEPTKSYNMLMRAIMEVGRNPKSKAAKLKLARTTGAFAASAAATAAATALFDAFKNRDDEDDLWTYLTEGGFWTDWTKAFLNGFAGNINIAGSIPLVGEALEALQGEDVTLMQFESLTNSLNAVTTFRDHFFGENKKKTTVWGAVKPMLTAVSQATGLPVSGLIANSEMLVRIYDPKLMQTKSNMASTEQAFEKLYDAVLGGDRSKELEIRTELAKGMYGKAPKSVKEIDAGISDQLAISDERILKAWQMKNTGKDTKGLGALYKEIQKDGFTDEMIKRAVNNAQSKYQAEYDALIEDEKPNEAQALLEKCAKYGMNLEKEKEPKDLEAELNATTYTDKELFRIIRNGDLTDIAAAAEIKIAESDAKKPEETVRSAVSGEFREEYVELVKAGKTRQSEELAGKLAIFDLDDEDLLEWVKDDYRSNLKKAIEKGDMKESERLIEIMKEEYGLDDESIASTVRSRFKQDYIDLVMAGKDREADELAEKLMDLGLKYADGNNRFKQANLNKWVLDWEKAQGEE